MIIRRAERGDARALSDLAIATYAAAFGHSLSAADLAVHLRENLSAACFERFLDEDVFLLAAIDERVVGYVQFGAVTMPVETVSGADRELRRLYVHADFQGRGNRHVAHDGGPRARAAQGSAQHLPGCVGAQ